MSLFANIDNCANVNTADFGVTGYRVGALSKWRTGGPKGVLNTTRSFAWKIFAQFLFYTIFKIPTPKFHIFSDIN
jgi:hypothetical protein